MTRSARFHWADTPVLPLHRGTIQATAEYKRFLVTTFRRDDTVRAVVSGRHTGPAPTLWDNTSNRGIQEIPRRKLRRNDTVRAVVSGRHAGPAPTIHEKRNHKRGKAVGANRCVRPLLFADFMQTKVMLKEIRHRLNNSEQPFKHRIKGKWCLSGVFYVAVSAWKASSFAPDA